MIESMKESGGKLRSTNEGEATEVTLETLPNFIKGVNATTFEIVEPFRKKKIRTDRSCIAQYPELERTKSSLQTSKQKL